MAAVKIFLRKDKTPITFQMIRNSKGKELRTLIENYGGKLVRFADDNSIKLRFPNEVDATSLDYLFSTKFIDDCIAKKCLLDINCYKLSKGPNHIHSGADFNSVMLGDMTWDELSFMSSKTVVRSVRSSSSFSYEEKLSIVKYILRNDLCSKIRDTEIWKDMQAKQICLHRSWYSMKNCFLKNIICELDTFGLEPSDKNKLCNKVSKENYSLCSQMGNPTTVNKCEIKDDSQSFGRSGNNKEIAVSHFDGQKCGLMVFNGFVCRADQKPPMEGGLGYRQNRNYYTLDEDIAIVNYIWTRGLSDAIKGRSMWLKMEDHFGRTWQSLKNRYLRYLLPNLEAYGLTVCDTKNVIGDSSKKSTSKNNRRSSHRKVPVKKRRRKLFYTQAIYFDEEYDGSLPDERTSSPILMERNERVEIFQNPKVTKKNVSHIIDNCYQYETTSIPADTTTDMLIMNPIENEGSESDESFYSAE